MKSLVLLISGVIYYQLVTAQPTYEQRIQDTVIGWWYKSVVGKPKPFQYLGRDFSIKQQELMNTVIEWMKKSYIPVAGIGTFRPMIYTDTYSHLPHMYGVDFRVWNVGLEKQWLDEKGFCKPIPEEYTQFQVNANAIPGGTPISFVNTPDQYLFAWMTDGYAESEQFYQKRINNNADPKIHPNIYKYLTCINNVHTVYLVPGNKLPVTPVSIGEYLNIVDAAIDRDKNYDQATHNKIRKAVSDLKEKYKKSLSDPAILGHSQPALLDYDGYSDPFEFQASTRIFKHYYPVYKITPSVLEKCKSDQPQWMAISFPYEVKEDSNQLYELYRALTENFNYDYAYNYFFDPEKVKGQIYKPINEESLKARLDDYRKRSYWKNPNEGKPLPPNIHFMDDFSSNTEGSKPSGWYSSTRGKHPVVTTVRNLPGKWVQLGYENDFSPNTSLKKPLPENFSVEFDAATDEFSSRTGGAVTLYLSSYGTSLNGKENKDGNGTVLTINLKSGNEADYTNNNYSGNAVIKINSVPEPNVDNYGSGISFTYQLREFTNKKTKVHVKLKVKNGEVTLFINEKQVMETKDFKTAYGKPCISCGVPAHTQFRILYFDNTTNDWGVEGKSDGVDVYISNVKIIKE